MAERRTRSRRRGLAAHAGVVLAMVLAGCGANDPDAAGVATPAPSAVPSPSAPAASGHTGDGWQQLPPPPLSGRVGAMVAAVDGAVVVAGGIDWTCPPGAECMEPQDPPFADGAVLDRETDRWEPIAAAPAGFWNAQTAVVGPDVHALVDCARSDACPTGRTLLRYRSDEDAWDRFDIPPDLGHAHLVAIEDGVVAYADSDEDGEVPDFRFDGTTERWERLPDDPLGDVYDRQVVHDDGRLLLFGSPIDDLDGTKAGAELDLATGSWAALPDAGGEGYQVWKVDDHLYLNPHFSVDAGGGVFDLTTRTWGPLPALPDDAGWNGDITGVVGHDDAQFAYAAGWVLDTTDTTWIDIPPRPTDGDVYDEVVTAAGTSLVVFGGQRWMGDDGATINEAWIWQAR